MTRAICSNQFTQLMTDSAEKWCGKVPSATDLETILIIGGGPIVIGQACEFDYSGTQACRVLRDEGYRVVLRQLQPATIMTDPEFRRRHLPSSRSTCRASPGSFRARAPRRAVLPTLGGQTALNLSIEAATSGLAREYRRRAHRAASTPSTRREPPRVQAAMTGDRVSLSVVGFRVHASTRRWSRRRRSATR